MAGDEGLTLARFVEVSQICLVFVQLLLQLHRFGFVSARKVYLLRRKSNAIATRIASRWILLLQGGCLLNGERHQALPKNICGRNFGQIFNQFQVVSDWRQKSAELAKTMSKNGQPCPKGRHGWYQYKELLQRSMHALVVDLFLLFFMLFWSNTGRKERRHRAGVEYMLGSILKTSKNNKLSVLEVLKLGKSYNWLMHHSVQNMGYTMWAAGTHDKYRYDTHVKTCISAQHLHQSSITQFLSQMAWTIFHLR